MRHIRSHVVNNLNGQLSILAVDDPGPGGASRVYDVVPLSGNAIGLRIEFHAGLPDHPRGLTNEVLLAVVIDRLQCFQKGPFACRENALALTKIEEAMHWLSSRCDERTSRGVEGELKK